MKKLILSITIILFAVMINNGTVNAAVTNTPTPKSSPTPSGGTVNNQTQSIDQQINNLKNKISNKVNQLKLVEKRGFIGTVTDASSTQLTLTDSNGNPQGVDVDELTKFSSATNSSFGVSDIKSGMVLEILGLYNKESQRILARDISEETEPAYLHGAVSSIDTKHYNINIVTSDNKNKILSITIGSSKIADYTKANGLSTAKFSDVTTAEHVIATGFWDKTDANTLNVTHLFLFSELPKNPQINISISPTAGAFASPSQTPLKQLK